jgi:predicted NAD/FAD-dependent oxidoreductase
LPFSDVRKNIVNKRIEIIGDGMARNLTACGDWSFDASIEGANLCALAVAEKLKKK